MMRVMLWAMVAILLYGHAWGGALEEQMFASIANNEAETVAALLGKGADLHALDERNQGPLTAAARLGHLETVRVLISHGAEVNRTSHLGTPLLVAAINGRNPVVKELLANGANVNHVEWAGFTALLAAAASGHMETVRILLDNGAGLDWRDITGSTALLWAVQAPQGAGTVALLLERGAGINSTDQYRNSPLAVAVLGEKPDMVKVLLEHGADANGQFGDGGSLLAEAINRKNEIIAALLREAGAKN
ncbi:MAG: ankyrin repeat domain-containing protein [SAR324 cluster bacterium]|nr:ankyrin repeat domain-containing protein [SAR324 cluster bacterium]